MRIEFNADDLRPLIRKVVAELLEQIAADRAKLDGRFGFSEPEAAALLGIRRHALRDLRRGGKIKASKPGARIVYSGDSLLELMRRNAI